MKTLTVFTPTYNRKHTLPRTFESLCRQTCRDFEWLIIDDGSTDGTLEWVKSLGTMVEERKQRYDWMGRLVDDCSCNGENFTIVVHLHGDETLLIHYIYKENGGLYTGYNVAYSYIETELCVCIDSDDYMPDDAVKIMLDRWHKDGGNKFCGVVGLDFNVVDSKPIGGYFPDGLREAYQMEVKHSGDTKQVMRTALMKEVAPQIGFKGERDFNPFYMLIQVLDKYPILVENANLCWVEYQIGNDSMSQGIWKQYRRSPKSYAKYRVNQMLLLHGNPLYNKFRLCVHYVSSCIFAKDWGVFKKTPLKCLTVLASPFGALLTLLVLWKNRK